jgi:hypothetical protein
MQESIHTFTNTDHGSCPCCDPASSPADTNLMRSASSSSCDETRINCHNDTCRSKKALYSPAQIAQKMNNKGVRLMNDGQYGKAVSCFLKATEFAQQDQQDVCACRFCTLASCVQYSTKKASFSGDDGYLHTLGISVRPESSGHNMGYVLPLIATLNLALSKHLMWVKRNDQHDINNLQKVANLYRLAFRWYMTESVNLGFMLIILNNLCEIHRQSNNSVKLESCLGHLRSALMVVSMDQSTLYKKMKLDGFFRTAFSATPCAAMA